MIGHRCASRCPSPTPRSQRAQRRRQTARARMFSVSSRLAMRHGPAPSARRVPTSRCASVARQHQVGGIRRTRRAGAAASMPCSISSARAEHPAADPAARPRTTATSPRTFAFVSGYVCASSLHRPDRAPPVTCSTACSSGPGRRRRSSRAASDRPARAIRPAASARASRASRDRTSASGTVP